MDRRQRRSREAIFRAFTELLAKKSLDRITVGEIIERADVGRATFYAHFETKDFLLRELCRELFCHVFDAAGEGDGQHRHLFDCEAPSSVFLHLLQHLARNDHHILDLLASEGNGLFLQYFKEGLRALIQKQAGICAGGRQRALPDGLWQEHLASTFVETVRWWVAGGRKESPETLLSYLQALIAE